jgi:hypothetical protein
MKKSEMTGLKPLIALRLVSMYVLSCDDVLGEYVTIHIDGLFVP